MFLISNTFDFSFIRSFFSGCRYFEHRFKLTVKITTLQIIFIFIRCKPPSLKVIPQIHNNIVIWWSTLNIKIKKIIGDFVIRNMKSLSSDCLHFIAVQRKHEERGRTCKGLSLYLLCNYPHQPVSPARQQKAKFSLWISKLYSTMDSKWSLLI